MLGGVYPLFIVNNAAMKLVYKHLLQSLIQSFGHIPRQGIVVSCCQSVFNLSRNCHTILYSSCTIYIPTSGAQVVQFFHILTNTLFWFLKNF